MTNLPTKPPNTRTPIAQTEDELEQVRLKRQMLLSPTVSYMSIEKYREDFKELFGGMEPLNAGWVTVPIGGERVKRVKVDTTVEKGA